MKLLFIIVFVLRLALSTLPAFEIDQTAFRFWSARLTEVGPAHFYSKEIFTDNPLGFLYVFWFLGELKNLFLPNLSFYSPGFDFLLKLPNNLADLFTGLLIYLILKRWVSLSWAKAGFLLYTLNPVIFFNSAIFGQFDGAVTLFMLLAVYLILIKKRLEMSALSYALACVIKPQAIFLVPALALLILASAKPIKWLLFGLLFFLGTLLLYWPFFPTNPLDGVFYVNQQSAQLFKCTTCFSFNFWGIFGNWRNDLMQFAGLPLVWWGIILLLVSLMPIFFLRPFWRRLKEPYFYLTATVSLMSFPMLLTRMHERYILYSLAFLLLASILIRSKFLISLYLFISFLLTLNLYLPYTYYNEQMKLTSGLAIWLSNNFQKMSLINFSAFIVLLIYLVKFYRGRDEKT